jgi:hypothetical protein
MAQDDVRPKIAQSERDFDIFSEASEDTADAWVDSLVGDTEFTDPADEAPSETMSFDEAHRIVAMTQSAEFQLFYAAAQDILNDDVAKSKDLNGTADSRALFQNMGMGVEQVRNAWNRTIAEAIERLTHATTEEKRKMNATVAQVLEATPEYKTAGEGPRKRVFVGDDPVGDSLPGMRIVYAEPQSKR